METKVICRLCLIENEDSFEINGKKGLMLNAASILTQHFWFEESDIGTFKFICSRCWWNVESFNEFYRRVKTKHQEVYGTCLSSKSDLTDKSCRQIDISIKSEPFVDIFTSEIQVNPLNIEDDIDNDGDAIATTDFEKVSSLIKCKPVKRRKEKKTRYHSLNDADTIKKYFLIQCNECEKSFETFRDIQMHYKTIHHQSGYLTCCDRKFFKLYRVMQHCMWHENPHAFMCPNCKKCFTDSVGLRDHMDNIHTPDHKKPFKCNICTKTFLKKHMLTSHKRLNHIKNEDKKFECHLCGQRFVILPFLRFHIKKVHEHSDSRICDICAKFFKCSKSYETHYLVAHTNIPQRVQCDKCNKWLKHKGTLKRHMQWHFETSEICKICGRVSSNKKALRAHIKLAHTKPSFECAACNKMFKKSQTLKEHMSIHTGVTDLYSCTFCTRTFRSSANMYAHRKRAHPHEYEANRVGKISIVKPAMGHQA